MKKSEQNKKVNLPENNTWKIKDLKNNYVYNKEKYSIYY